jgi:hypothetical protein
MPRPTRWTNVFRKSWRFAKRRQASGLVVRMFTPPSPAPVGVPGCYVLWTFYSLGRLVEQDVNANRPFRWIRWKAGMTAAWPLT